MIVVNTKGRVVGHGIKVERVDAQGESNLIKVTVHNDGPNNFYYIGTDDRDEYTFHNVTITNDDATYEYINGELFEIEINNDDLLM